MKSPRIAHVTRRSRRLVCLASGALALTVGSFGHAAGARSRQPSGEIAFIGGDGEVHLVAADGGNDRTLTSAADFPHGTATRWFAWSPDGTRLVLWREGVTTATEAFTQIYVVPTDGAHARRVARGLWPAWSPDGTRVAFVSATHGQVLLVDANGTKRRRLTRGGQPVFIHAPETAPLVWAPGKQIVFESRRSQLVAVRPSTGMERVLSPPSTIGYWPSPGHDGSTVTFVEGPGQPADYRIREVVLARTTTTRIRKVTRGHDDAFPALSPSGGRIAFDRRLGDDQQSDEIFVANVNGSHMRRLTRNHRGDFFPQWSPDGRWIAFEGNRGISVIGSDGRGERRVALGSLSSWRPAQH